MVVQGILDGGSLTPQSLRHSVSSEEKRRRKERLNKGKGEGERMETVGNKQKRKIGRNV